MNVHFRVQNSLIAQTHTDELEVNGHAYQRSWVWSENALHSIDLHHALLSRRTTLHTHIILPDISCMEPLSRSLLY